MTDVKTRIADTVKANDVVLYMKGTKDMPQCGFSSRVAGVLNFMGVDYADVNVLADEEIRQGIKDYSDWPTIPQLYVKGEFVGGCDIITEMTLSGELDQLLEQNGVAFDKDAADKIREAQRLRCAGGMMGAFAIVSRTNGARPLPPSRATRPVRGSARSGLKRSPGSFPGRPSPPGICPARRRGRQGSERPEHRRQPHREGARA